MIKDVIIMILVYLVGICVGFGLGYDKGKRGSRNV